jgi:hypothetical protein
MSAADPPRNGTYSHEGYPAPYQFGPEEFRDGIIIVPFQHNDETNAACTQCVFCLKVFPLYGPEDDYKMCNALLLRGWGLLPIEVTRFHAVCPFCRANPACKWGPFTAAEICEYLSVPPER